jgi:hypothetical protein
MSVGRSLFPLAMTAFVIGAFIFQIWIEHHQNLPVLPKAPAALSSEQPTWEKEHPREARELSARLDRAISRLDLSMRQNANCYEHASPDHLQTCLKQVRRNEALWCLIGPDWQDCEAINH